MPGSLLLRSAFAAVLVGALLPVAFSRPQDSQSVAEAARRAREKKKGSAKPAKVITDDTLDVKRGDVQSAVAEEPKIAGAPDAANQPGNRAANPGTGDAQSPAAKDEKLGDLDLLQRENRLDQDTYYSQPNFASDTAGKQKLDDEQHKIGDKRQEIDRLKGKLADLQKSLGESSSSSSRP